MKTEIATTNIVISKNGNIEFLVSYNAEKEDLDTELIEMCSLFSDNISEEEKEEIIEQGFMQPNYKDNTIVVELVCSTNTNIIKILS